MKMPDWTWLAGFTTAALVIGGVIAIGISANEMAEQNKAQWAAEAIHERERLDSLAARGCKATALISTRSTVYEVLTCPDGTVHRGRPV
jgi:hypothetical protein